ncbi:hypothetical protein LUZ60_005949 [Juncus effusus]|nr:hypothetical protein LUZ60_005949 [Juncus effusus]
MSNTIVQLEHQNETKEVLITHIENVHSPDEAERAKLCNKSKLRSLTLKWSIYDKRSVNNNNPFDECILDKLQPHRNLECLTLDGYSSIGFSGWVMNMAIFLPNLVKIDICNLAQCDQLPPLKQLPNLEVLNISNVPNIKEMDFIVCGGSQSFAKLRALSLAHLEKLNEWSLCGCSKQKNLPQCSEGPALLEEFRIYNCPSMGILPWNLHALTSLKELGISDSTQELAELCKEWVHFKHSLRPMLHIKGTKSFYYQTKEKRDLSIIENLVIESVDDLDMLPLSLQGLTSLRSIEIRNCSRLERVPEWIGYIATLEELFFTGCDSLDSMPRSVLRLVSSGEFTSTYCNERQGRLYLRQKEMVDSLETS